MKPLYDNPGTHCQFLEHYNGYDLYFASGMIPELYAIAKDHVKTGFEKGRSGEDNILAYAYGLAKAQLLFIDIAEQEYMLNSAIGWLVVGHTGEHGDKIHWPAFFTLNKLRATQVSMLLNKQAELWAKNRENRYDNPPYGWSLLDPNMKCDYTGTVYDLMPIKHETDPSRISFTNEVCPECNCQVYETVYGSICEKGHIL